MQSGTRKASAAPDDDPFADLLGSSGAKAERSALDDFSDLGGPASGPALRIDDMFGGTGGGIGGDPLALRELGSGLNTVRLRPFQG